MDILIALLFRLAVLCGYVVVPGWAALRLAGFRSRSRADMLLAGLALGAAYTAEAVTVLLLLHAYTRVTILLALIVPVLAVAVPRRLPDAPGEPALVSAARDSIDRAVLTASAAFICVYLVDAATSPMTWWDGLATWGKWAPDWGRRTDSMNYLVGGYPQLVPRVISVLYKLTGNSAGILPLDFFAAHAFHVLFSAWFVFAAVRLSDLLALPAWPAVLAGLGSLLFREHIGAGTVDVLVAAQVTTLLALYAGWSRGTWHTTRVQPAWVLGASAFGALFTKLTGVIGPLLMAGLQATWGRRPEQPASSTTVRRALAAGVLLLLPFIVEQGYTELRRNRFQPKPFEVNLSVRQTPHIVGTDAELTYRNGTASERLQLLQLRFWNNYDVPAALRFPFTLFLAGCLVLSLGSAVARGVIPILAVFTLMWSVWSSYDQRNIFAVLPIAALAAVYGARASWRLRPALLWQSGVALFAGLFLLLTGSGLLKDVQRRAAGLSGGERPLGARLQAMRGGAEARIALFYPQYDADYRLVRTLAERTHAEHVLVTSPMYRFFANGAHPWGVWPYDLLKAGDVFAGHESQRPPLMPGWVLVRQGRGHRVWVFDPSLRERSFSIAGPGPHGVGTSASAFLDVPLDEIRRRGYVLWQTELEPGSADAAVGYEPDGMRLGPVSSTAGETLDDGTTSLSGLIALDEAGPPPAPDARVRITVRAVGGSPKVRAFRSSMPIAASNGPS